MAHTYVHLSRNLHIVYVLGMAMRIYLPMRIDADIAPYPTYVGYGAIYAAHISDRHPISTRMAIPKKDIPQSNKMNLCGDGGIKWQMVKVSVISIMMMI